MSPGAALSLYVLLVLIWSSTWVAIKIGLEDAPARAIGGAALVVAGLLAARGASRAREPVAA